MVKLINSRRNHPLGRMVFLRPLSMMASGLLLCSCDPKPSERTESARIETDTAAASRETPIPEHTATAKTRQTDDSALIEKLRQFNPAGTYKDMWSRTTAAQKDEFRTAMKQIAEETDTAVPEVLATLLKLNPAVIDGLASLVADTYLDEPGIVASAFVGGLSGRTRSYSLMGLTSKLRDNDDVDDLKKVYETLPPSQDRGDAASTYVNTIASSQCLTDAMTSLRNLDLKEERSYCVMDLRQFVRENRDTISKEELDHYYQLSGEYGQEQSARASIGN